MNGERNDGIEDLSSSNESHGRVDVFLIGGQSNAEGTGDPGRAPTVPVGVGYEYRDEGDEIVHLEEPIGRGDGAASWAAFANEYHERTGRSVVLVSKAVGGSAQHVDADWYFDGEFVGHWDDGGTLRPTAIEALRSCLGHLETNGWEYELRGVLWHQGETDANSVDECGITVSQYKNAFRRMLSDFRSAFDEPEMGLYLFKIGRQRDGDTEGWREVRAAQDSIATADDAVHVVFDDAVSFAESGNMQDHVHYDQEGYNRMGCDGAVRVAAIIDDARHARTTDSPSSTLT